MKRIVILLALLLPAGAWAQTTTEFGARASVEANLKISKGFHLYVEEELRTNTTSLDNIRTTVGLTYKPAKWFKMGVGYTLINPYSASNTAFKAPRHRFFADVAGSLNAGDFQFTLKERFQYTHRCGTFNVYQNTPNAMALKSKFTVKYKGWYVPQPYLSFEMRTVLNDPWGTAGTTQQWNKSGTKTYYDYTHTGYTHVYNNRYRAEAGVELEFNKSHSLKPYVLVDFNSDYEIDTNAEGTRVFSAAYVNSIKVSLGLSYVFSF